MAQALELTGLTATLALVAPLLVLALVIARGTRSAAARPEAWTRRAAPSAKGVSQSSQGGGEVAAELPRETPTVVDPARRLAEQITEAEAAGREAELPMLHIELARGSLASGDRAAAAESLRTSLRISAKLGMKLEHAAARIELGDIAGVEGDLTTACEHWSIARSLLHELKHEEGIKVAEGRMRDNRCPTDWVLNDF